METSPDAIVKGLTWFVVFIFSTTFHEAALLHQRQTGVKRRGRAAFDFTR